MRLMSSALIALPCLFLLSNISQSLSALKKSAHDFCPTHITHAQLEPNWSPIGTQWLWICGIYVPAFQTQGVMVRERWRSLNVVSQPHIHSGWIIRPSPHSHDL